MTIEEINTVCFIGAGTMGSANSLVAAVSGYTVVVYDLSAENLEKVKENHVGIGAFLLATDYCSAQELEAGVSRVRLEHDLAKAVADADLVSESIVEDLDVKRTVHAALDRLCPAKTILTTNTSALLVSDIESAVDRGEQFAALHSHYGSALIDIMSGPRTSEQTIDVLNRYVISLNCVPLLLRKENRGYVLNAILGSVLTTAMVLLVEGIASKEEIDAAWMKHRAAPMGPFGMMDLFGLNVVYDGWRKSESDPKLDSVKAKVIALLESYLIKGELGVKTGRGFYRYPDPVFQQPGFTQTEGEASTSHYAMTTSLIGNAILLAENDVATPAEIDRAWTVGMTLDTGPFSLLEQIGTDAFLQLLTSFDTVVLPEEKLVIERYLAQA